MRRFEKRKAFPDIEYTFFKNHLSLSEAHENFAKMIIDNIKHGRQEQLIMGYTHSINLEMSERSKMKNRIMAQKLRNDKQTFITAVPDKDITQSDSAISAFIHELYPASGFAQDKAQSSTPGLKPFLGIRDVEAEKSSSKIRQIIASTSTKKFVNAFSEESIRKGAEDRLFDK